MVQYNGPFPQEIQRISPTKMFHNEQSNSEDVKDVVKDMNHQLQYIDRWLDKVQDLMKELQLVPGTIPKGTGVTRNQILSQKQLWIGQQTDDVDLAPMVL